MDNELFWRLLEPVHPRAAGFCRKLTGDRDRGDDLYQDALLIAMRKFAGLKDLAAFRPWLFRILINSYKNQQRNSWWRRRVRLKRELDESDEPNDPREKYDTRRWLRRALAALPAEDQALMILFEMEGWPAADLAALFNKPQGTIRARLSRARRKMRVALERYLPQPPTNRFAGEGTYALPRSETTDK